MKIEDLNRILSIFISIINVYFLYITVSELYKFGFFEGFKYTLFPLLIFINLSIIPLLLSFSRTFKRNKSTLILNLGCLFITIFLIFVHLFGK